MSVLCQHKSQMYYAVGFKLTGVLSLIEAPSKLLAEKGACRLTQYMMPWT